MPRSNNLDSVADDNLDVTPQGVVPSKPVEPKAPEAPQPEHIIPSQPVRDEFRQKIDTILGHTTHSFSSFLVHPKVFNFQEKDDQEEIILVLRQHWFTNVGWVLTTLLMSLLPTLFRIIPVFEFLPGNYLFVAALFWYLMTLAFAFEKFLGWYFDVYILTDERVVDIDFNNLLNKHFSEASLNVIQDVSSQVTGMAATMFNYGTVRVQTAAEIPEIEFENVPNPEKVIKVLQQLRQQEEQEAIEGRIR